MKPEPLSITAMRASRLLAALALSVSVALLCTADLPVPRGWLAPQAALCISLLALAVLLVSIPRPWTRGIGGILAAIACLLALTPPWVGLAPLLAHPSLHPMAAMISGGLSTTTRIVLVAAALAVVFSPGRSALGRTLATGAAAVGLLAVATSLIGFALGNPRLALLGLDDGLAAQPLAVLLTGTVLLALLSQRGDAGWLSVLLGPSAAGSSARGIIAWTVLGPLAFALLALSGERQGFYNLEFAYALLAAVMCCGLTALVLWNASRVERAQARAASARDAMQLAANRLRLARSATGIEMWEWLPARREWFALDGAQHFDPSTNEFLEAGLTRALRDGKAEFEFPVRRYDEPLHEERWMLATCWREQRDEQPVVVGITVDITERKHAALALETSETRLQLAARALPGFVYDWNCASGKILRTSGIEQMLGYRGAEISPVSRWWEDLIHPDDRDRALPRQVARAAGPDSEQDNIACEYRVRHANGSYQWIWDHCVLVRDRTGQVTRVVGSVLDITERKEAAARLAVAERSVRDNLRRLELALDASSVGMWDWDLATDRMSWTRQTHLITGVDERQFTGRAQQFFELLLPAGVDHAGNFRRDAALPDALSVPEQQLQRPDGTRRWIQHRVILIGDPDGSPGRIVGTLRDITRRKDLELEREALLAAERAARSDLLAAAQAKDEFLATISHELRTPLNAILGWTTLLQRPRVDAPTIADGLKVIERNARAQTQLLGDLLDANQMMSGKLSLTFEPMDLNEAVRATLDSMRVTIAARKVTVDPQVAATPLSVMGDSVRLQQVISNLLSNAIKFTPPGGIIKVVTGADTEQAYCEVRDNGEGIAAEFLPHIFEKFSQADGGSARRFAGLGLGLAITRQLVESHGGSISVHSEGRGRGATFRVQMPRLKSIDSAPPAESAIPTDKPLAGLRILAVDDEADSREYLQRLLAEQGADIVSVASAAEALDALGNGAGAGRERFNLLVSDIGMPGSTGYDLIEAVRGQLKVDASRLPAVALTAFARREDSARALDKGFQKHLAKPVQVGRLIGAIRQLTGRQQARGSRRAQSLPRD